MPLVSILLLNWNNYPDTCTCIKSLRQLDYPNYNILVVDNGSEDESVTVLKEKFPEIDLIESAENLGFTGGNNLGIRHAIKGGAEYIWILNNDTTVARNCLSHMVEKLNSDKNLGTVGCTILNTDEQHSIQAFGGGRVIYWSGQLSPNVEGAEDSRLDYVAGTSMLVRKQVFQDIGLLDDRIFIYWEDIEFTHRLKKNGYKVGYSPEAVIYHVENASMADASLQREYLFCKGTVIFYRDYVTLWPVSLMTAYFGKVVKRLLRADFASIGAVTKGFWEGINAPKKRSKFEMDTKML